MTDFILTNSKAYFTHAQQNEWCYDPNETGFWEVRKTPTYLDKLLEEKTQFFYNGSLAQAVALGINSGFGPHQMRVEKITVEQKIVCEGLEKQLSEHACARASVEQK